jgi:hypothetical protein
MIGLRTCGLKELTALPAQSCSKRVGVSDVCRTDARPTPTLEAEPMLPRPWRSAIVIERCVWKFTHVDCFIAPGMDRPTPACHSSVALQAEHTLPSPVVVGEDELPGDDELLVNAVYLSPRSSIWLDSSFRARCERETMNRNG